MNETIKYIDFIIATEDIKIVTESLLLLNNITEVIASGETKTSVTVKDEDYLINIDFRLVKPDEYATTLNNFTYTKDHNIMMRQRTILRIKKINENGVKKEKTIEEEKIEIENKLIKHLKLELIQPKV